MTLRRKKSTLNNISLTVPVAQRAANPIGRLRTLSTRRDRPVSYLVLEAIFDYLRREEARPTGRAAGG